MVILCCVAVAGIVALVCIVLNVYNGLCSVGLAVWIWFRVLGFISLRWFLIVHCSFGFRLRGVCSWCLLLLVLWLVVGVFVV